MGWPVEHDGDRYRPIPASWLAHPHAVDRDRRRGARLLAVAATQRGGRTLRIRYAHPSEPHVLVCQTAAERDAGGIVPAGLVTGTGWPRSLCPGPSDPSDGRRRCEREHMATVWTEHVDDPPWADERREVTA